MPPAGQRIARAVHCRSEHQEGGDVAEPSRLIAAGCENRIGYRGLVKQVKNSGWLAPQHQRLVRLASSENQQVVVA
jgi:hypothetical protein